MRAGRRVASAWMAAFFVAAWAAMGVGVQAANAASANVAPAKTVAVLLHGPEPLRGLPFFRVNAIMSLVGEYSIGVKAEDAASALKAAGERGLSSPSGPAPRAATVWCTREAIVLSPDWKSLSGSATAPFRVLSTSEGDVLCVRGEGYSLFVRSKKADAALASFAAALNRRFAVFFNSAASDAELSFPALIEY